MQIYAPSIVIYDPCVVICYATKVCYSELRQLHLNYGRTEFYKKATGN